MNDDGFKMNWLAFWTVVGSLIIIGWSFGLIIHPPEAEVLHCPSRDSVQIIPGEEGVVIFCND